MIKSSNKIVATLVGILLFSFFVYLIYPKVDNTLDEIVPKEYTITYTYGGGFGTVAQTVSKEAIIKSNGDVTIQVVNSNSADPMKFTVDKDDVEELYKYLMKNNFKKMREKITDDKVMDAGTEYIELETPDFTRKIGGYAASTNNRFAKLENKIKETIGKDKIDEYNKIIENNLK